MGIKLFDSELKVMEVLWRSGDLPAGQIARVLHEETGWNRNTTYTVIKKCIEKGAVRRSEPGFICRSLISRDQVQKEETDALRQKMFGGSFTDLFAAMVGGKKLSTQEIERLKKLVEDLEK